MAEKRIGIVPRGTIVQLAKSMLREKIRECEREIRAARYGRRETALSPSAIPATVRVDAKRYLIVKREKEKLKHRIESAGFELDYQNKIVRSSRVRHEAERHVQERRAERLAKAMALREETLIALIVAKDASAAADLLRNLRVKIDAI